MELATEEINLLVDAMDRLGNRYNRIEDEVDRYEERLMQLQRSIGQLKIGMDELMGDIRTLSENYAAGLISDREFARTASGQVREVNTIQSRILDDLLSNKTYLLHFYSSVHQR